MNIICGENCILCGCPISPVPFFCADCNAMVYNSNDYMFCTVCLHMKKAVDTPYFRKIQAAENLAELAQINRKAELMGSNE
jgi:hypothetical protein